MDFDVVVLGTGSSESIAAAALSKAGYKVVHVDANQYYGGDEASLTLEEIAEWADTRAAAIPNGPSSDYLVHQRMRYTSISRTGDLPPQSRQYSLSLAPSIVPAIGPHIDSLILSGVSRYGSFKLLEQVALYERPGFVHTVPGSKEDVFKSKALSLVDKRRLMRFLMFAAGDFEGKTELEGRAQMPFVQFLQQVFSLKDKAASAIAYALAFCISPEEPTLPAMHRTRRYLRSAGRYGASPFLVGHYGGLGETAQGFCRTSAVKGGLYVLGRRVLAVNPPSLTSDPASETINSESASSVADLRYSVELEDFTEQLTGKVLLASSDHLPPSLHPPVPDTSRPSHLAVARCIAVIDRPMVFTPSEVLDQDAPADIDESGGTFEGEPPSQPTQSVYEVDTAVLVFPPGSLGSGLPDRAAHVLITGPGSMSTPKGTWTLNISLPPPENLDPSRPAEDLLRPYLDAALTLTAPPGAPPPTPLFTVFYLHYPTSTLSPSNSESTKQIVVVPPPCSQLLPAIADAATENAEYMFWRAVEQLKAAGVQRRPTSELSGRSKEESEDKGEGERDTQEELGEVDSFWPPLDAVDDSESETTDDW